MKTTRLNRTFDSPLYQGTPKQLLRHWHPDRQHLAETPKSKPRIIEIGIQNTSRDVLKHQNHQPNHNQALESSSLSNPSSWEEQTLYHELLILCSCHNIPTPVQREKHMLCSLSTSTQVRRCLHSCTHIHIFKWSHRFQRNLCWSIMITLQHKRHI
jgi:hypothetical protein